MPTTFFPAVGNLFVLYKKNKKKPTHTRLRKPLGKYLHHRSSSRPNLSWGVHNGAR